MYIDVMAGYASCDGDKLYISFISVIFTVTHFSDKGNDKNTTQNIPKNVISSEEIHFSRKGLGMSQTSPPSGDGTRSHILHLFPAKPLESAALSPRIPSRFMPLH